MSVDKTAIRNAATIILVRRAPDGDPGKARVLMGQRGAKAAFMPNKFVFPGGAVDAEDASVALAAEISEPCRTRLSEDSDPALVSALQVAAVRELWEETGLVLGLPGQIENPLDDWASYAETGFVPSGDALKFVFRAITPPGRPRRFDARFFMADASALHGDPDDFSRASDELSSLQWIALNDARGFDLPFITEVVLAELHIRLSGQKREPGVPFFRNDDEESLFLRLGGSRPLDVQMADNSLTGRFTSRGSAAE